MHLSFPFYRLLEDVCGPTFLSVFFNDSNFLLPAKIAASHHNTSLGNVHGKTKSNEGREFIGKLQISAS